MASVLAAILDTTEPQFTGVVQNLERASGRPGLDVRLIAEMASTVNRKTRELGLDPADTTNQELFHALQSLVAQHDVFLARQLGVDDPEDVERILPRVASFINRLAIPRSCWAIKPSVIKKFLKAQPPKKVMKAFGYRSIDSFLKRESVADILCAARLVESTQWHTKYLKQYKKLRSSDFEQKDVEVLYRNDKRWNKLAAEYVQKEHRNITHLKELGVITVLPLPIEHMRGLCVTLIPIVLHYINEIRAYSALFKLKQVKHDFGSFVASQIQDDAADTAVMAGHPLHWKTIQKHFGKKRTIHPAVFEPHLQPEDLYYRKAEAVLYRIEPALHFWQGLDYVASVRGNEIVSLNLLDNAVSYCNGLQYGQHARGFVKQSLWNEMIVRYMAQEPLEQQVISQLSNELLEPDFAGVVS